MKLKDDTLTSTPTAELATAPTPAASVPMKLPSTEFDGLALKLTPLARLPEITLRPAAPPLPMVVNAAPLTNTPSPLFPTRAPPERSVPM